MDGVSVLWLVNPPPIRCPLTDGTHKTPCRRDIIEGKYVYFLRTNYFLRIFKRVREAEIVAILYWKWLRRVSSFLICVITDGLMEF